MKQQDRVSLIFRVRTFSRFRLTMITGLARAHECAAQGAAADAGGQDGGQDDVCIFRVRVFAKDSKFGSDYRVPGLTMSESGRSTNHLSGNEQFVTSWIFHSEFPFQKQRANVCEPECGECSLSTTITAER